MGIKWKYNDWKTNVYTPKIEREKSVIEALRTIAEELHQINIYLNPKNDKKGDSTHKE